MKSEICPVCLGKGKIEKSLEEVYGSRNRMKTCNGCEGKGWIEVHEDTPIPSWPDVLPWPGTITWPTHITWGPSYSSCPNCGRDRNSPGGTGCGREHYGTYCCTDPTDCYCKP